MSDDDTFVVGPEAGEGYGRPVGRIVGNRFIPAPPYTGPCDRCGDTGVVRRAFGRPPIPCKCPKGQTPEDNKDTTQ